MNLILLRSDDHWSDDQRVQLTDHRALHIRTVLRADVGDSLRVGLLGGLQGSGRILSLHDEAVTLEVELGQQSPSRHRFDIVLALPRPKMLRRILRAAAEFGVSHLHLIHSARVDKSFWQSPLLKQEKLEAALWEGLERSRDTIAPEVHRHRLFRPFVEDQLPLICKGRPCWIADRGAPLALTQTPPGPAVVMIGPEGGFVPFEIGLATASAARRVHLGERTLSVDTAFSAVLAQGLSAI